MKVNYEVVDNITINTQHDIKISTNDITALSDEDKQLLDKQYNGLIHKDRTLVSMWDIETYSECVGVPTIDDDYTIFAISISFAWQYSSKPLFTVVISERDSNEHPDIDYMIICGTEDNVIKCYADVYKRMNPDINGTFNGGSFDWPLLRKKFMNLRNSRGAKHGLRLLREIKNRKH